MAPRGVFADIRGPARCWRRRPAPPTLSRQRGTAEMIRGTPRVFLLLAALASVLPAPITASPEGSGKPGPVIEPGVAEAVEGGRTARVNVVLSGRRPLPFHPTAADETSFVRDVAAAHWRFDAARPARGLRVI